MIIKQLGLEFKFDEEVINTAEISDIYLQMSLSAEEKFEENFDTRFKDIESVLDNATDYFVNEIYNNVIKESVKILQEKEIYTYNVESLSKKAESMGLFNLSWNIEMNSLCERFDEIEAENQLEKEYRDFRKASRGRVIGGGFGLSGALEGMAKAGMVNMTTGLAHSVANSIGNRKTDYKSKKSLKELYKVSKEPLVSATSITVFAFRYVMMDILTKEKGMKFYEPKENTVSKVKAILESLESCEIEDIKKQDLIVQMLVYDPYNEDIYRYLVKNYGDANCTIYEDSKLTGNAYSVNDEKSKMLENYVGNLIIKTNEELFSALEEFKRLYDYLGGKTLDYAEHYLFMVVKAYIDNCPLNSVEEFTECVEVVGQLNLGKCNQYTLQLYCKNIEMDGEDVLNRLFEVLEVCQKHNIECEKYIKDIIDRYVLKLDYNSLEIVRDARDVLQNINRISNVGIEKLVASIDKVYGMHRMAKMYCNGYEYETEQEVEVAREERDRFISLTNNINANDEEKLLEIKEIIENEFKMKNKEEYREFIENSLKAYDRRYRCVCGIDYDTRQRADEVRKILFELVSLVSELNIEDIGALTNAKTEISNVNLADEIKQDFILVIDRAINLCNKISQLILKTSYNNRCEQTFIRYEIEMLSNEIAMFKNVMKSNIISEKYNKYAEEFTSYFKNVFGVAQQETILESNKRYIKMVENARKYQDNVLNKSTEKKSIFAKMKDGVKETFSKGYVDDYNMVTSNGMYMIPSLEMQLNDNSMVCFSVDYVKELDMGYAQQLVNLKELYSESNIEKYNNREIEESFVSGESIIKPDKELDEKLIEEAMKEYSSSFVMLDTVQTKKDLRAEAKMLKMMLKTQSFKMYLVNDDGYQEKLNIAVDRCGRNAIDKAIKNDTILFIIEGSAKSYLFTENGLYIYENIGQNGMADYYRPEMLCKVYVDEAGQVVVETPKEKVIEIYGISKELNNNAKKLLEKIIGNMY